jgi:hypothetical protein
MSVKVASAGEIKADIVANDSPSFTPVFEDNLSYQLGWSIAVSGDTLIAGSWDGNYCEWCSEDDEPLPGAARVFIRTSVGSNLDWEQQGDPLIVDDGEGGVYEGYRVAIDGDTALISATKRCQYCYTARLFVFERSNGIWNQTKMLHAGEDNRDDGAILRVALEGNTGRLYFSIHS